MSVQVGDDITVETNTRVRALEQLVGGVPGVTETVPSYAGLLVYYDPSAIGYDALCGRIETLGREVEHASPPPSRRVELPCCYDPELGLDVEGAATRLGLSVPELVALHSGTPYLVYFIGFTPGLPYMALPERLHIPRLETPRTKVPVGSVGLGGAQCCIYSVESPGGYWILGRTPVRLYDPGAAEPVLLRPGDEIRFRPIDRAEYDAIAAAAEARAFRPVIR